MFHYLTLEVRNLMIEELRNYWADHPRYPELSNNIQGKYSFDQRPQFGMVVKTGGANNNSLSTDNFLGTVVGYSYLAKTNKLEYGSIEWVKDHPFIKPPEGIYILDIVQGSPNGKYETYAVKFTKYKRIVEELVFQISDTEYQLLNTPVDGTLKLYEQPSNFLIANNKYTFDGGLITLEEPIPEGFTLSARYTELQVDEMPNVDVKADLAYHNLIEGLVIYFGRRLRVGDQQAIVVLNEKEDVYNEYGGRFDVSVEIEIIARDVHSQADLADRTTIWMWSILRDRLATRGISMNEVSLGGESEEVYDENGDDYFYTASISTTLQTDWFLHIPLINPILSFNDSGIVGTKILPDIPNQIGFTGLIGDSANRIK